MKLIEISKQRLCCANIIPFARSLAHFFTCSSRRCQVLEEMCISARKSATTLILPKTIRWTGCHSMLRRLIELKAEVERALRILDVSLSGIPWGAFELMEEILAPFAHWTGVLESRKIVTISQVWPACKALRDILRATLDGNCDGLIVMALLEKLFSYSLLTSISIW